jgi:hypothetical protein
MLLSRRFPHAAVDRFSNFDLFCGLGNSGISKSRGISVLGVRAFSGARDAPAFAENGLQSTNNFFRDMLRVSKPRFPCGEWAIWQAQ